MIDQELTTVISEAEQLYISEIAICLRRFGLYRRYKGCNRLAYAIYLVLEKESRLEAVIKEIYIPVAKRFGCTWSAVERSLRVASNNAWINNYDELCEIAGASLRTPPTPAEFLDILADYVKLQSVPAYRKL